MDVKLTLKLDQDIIEQAKNYAKIKNNPKSKDTGFYVKVKEELKFIKSIKDLTTLLNDDDGRAAFYSLFRSTPTESKEPKTPSEFSLSKIFIWEPSFKHFVSKQGNAAQLPSPVYLTDKKYLSNGSNGWFGNERAAAGCVGDRVRFMSLILGPKPTATDIEKKTPDKRKIILPDLKDLLYKIYYIQYWVYPSCEDFVNNGNNELAYVLFDLSVVSGAGGAYKVLRDMLETHFNIKVTEWKDIRNEIIKLTKETSGKDTILGLLQSYSVTNFRNIDNAKVTAGETSQIITWIRDRSIHANVTYAAILSKINK